MDKTIRKYKSLDEMKADEYRYWQSRPVWERTDAVSELTQEHYAIKGEGRDVPRLQRNGPSGEADAENAKAAYAAMAQFGAPLEGLTSADFAGPVHSSAWDANR